MRRDPAAVTVRHGEHGDLPVCVDLVRQNITTGSFQALDFDPEITRETLTRRIDSSDAVVLVACLQESDIIGLCVGHLTSSSFGKDLVAGEEILFVQVGKRGGWAAPKLIHAFTRWAVGEGARRITFGNAYGMNDRAYTKLFRRFGFQRAGSIMYLEV